MKRYLLIKDWESKRHGKTIIRGTYVVITMENELTELIEGEYIEAQKEKKKKNKSKKIEDNGGIDITTDN